MDNASEVLLLKCHPDLARVIKLAFEHSAVKFRVTETLRTEKRQRQLVNAGASQTMRSRHLPGKDGLSRACDVVALVGGKVAWDWPLYERIAVAVKQAAHELRVPVEWGGDWKSFKDGPHYQLPWSTYP
jgi:peptidoglycan L-alanyl-D-glutamate endopeptidase CwlK